jgi:hypothetical protein
LYELSFSQDVDRECLKILEAQSTSPTVDFWVRELRSSVKTVLKRKRWNSDCSIFYDQIVARLNQRFVEACKQGKRIGLLKISE